MSLHVIAKIYVGKRIIGYRLLDSNVKLSDTRYRCEDCNADEVREQYLKHRWEYELFDSYINGQCVNDKDKGICGFYRRTDRESLRTPDGIPLIKDGGKTISNVDTLMEIQPGIFVDYMGCIKPRNTAKKSVSVMSVEDSYKRSVSVGKKNLKKCRDAENAEDNKKHGISVDDERLSREEGVLLFAVNELDIKHNKVTRDITNGLIQFLNSVGKKEPDLWGESLKYLGYKGFISIRIMQREKKIVISNVTITESGRNKIDEVKKNIGEEGIKMIRSIL